MDTYTLLQTPARWGSLSLLQLEALFYTCLVHHSRGSFRVQFINMMKLYSHCVRTLSADRRRKVFDAICDGVERGRLSYTGMRLFAAMDPDPEIVSAAVVTYAARRPVEGDPLLGVKEVLYGFQRGCMTNPGAVLRGLALLRDGRVNGLVFAARAGLSDG
jgi:hypothetical protein